MGEGLTYNIPVFKGLNVLLCGSVFVLLRGASKEEAFRIGKEICDRVTADNPKPVKLKFEKVSVCVCVQ